MKSGGFHVKSTQNLVKANVSTKTIQFDECRRGAMTPDFMKSGVIAPSMYPPNWRIFVETSDFIRFWVDFTWNPLDFMNVSFWVMIKYRSFLRKTNQWYLQCTIVVLIKLIRGFSYDNCNSNSLGTNSQFLKTGLVDHIGVVQTPITYQWHKININWHQWHNIYTSTGTITITYQEQNIYTSTGTITITYQRHNTYTSTGTITIAYQWHNIYINWYNNNYIHTNSTTYTSTGTITIIYIPMVQHIHQLVQ